MPPNAKAPPLAVTMGDPAGIGPEVILKAAAALAERRGAPRLAVIGWKRRRAGSIRFPRRADG
jgi:4-hydroxy-L-threonine phosphate dehydrogenase PdxA